MSVLAVNQVAAASSRHRASRSTVLFVDRPHDEPAGGSTVPSRRGTTSGKSWRLGSGRNTGEVHHPRYDCMPWQWRACSRAELAQKVGGELGAEGCRLIGGVLDWEMGEKINRGRGNHPAPSRKTVSS
jgi:hypothetical protein